MSNFILERAAIVFDDIVPLVVAIKQLAQCVTEDPRLFVFRAQECVVDQLSVLLCLDGHVVQGSVGCLYSVDVRLVSVDSE